MNSEFFATNINFIENFKEMHNLYSEFAENYRQDKSDFGPSTYFVINQAAHKRVEEVKQLKEKVSKLQDIIHPDIYKKIMSSIENEEALASMLESDCANFSSTHEEKYKESVITGLEYEKECGMQLNYSVSMLEDQMRIYIAGLAFSGRISIEDVREVSKNLDKKSPFQRELEDLIIELEKKQKQEKVEQPIEEEKKPDTFEPSKVELQPLVGQVASVKPHEPTLADKIAVVNYARNGNNMVKEVQELTIEDRMAQISASIARLAGKEKLTLREMIEIKTLQQEQVELEAYVETLSNQKLSRSEMKRNKKLQKATERLHENATLLQQEKTNSEEYNSKIMRFLSARRQERLEDQLLALSQKRGVIQDKQKASAIARYNRKSGKITRKARVLGTFKGIGDFANAKLEDLKAFRDQIVQEATAFSQDARRFFSSRDMLPSLQESNIIMIDPNMSIEEHRRLMEQTKSA